MTKFKPFFVWFLLLVQLFSLAESRCPSPCKCDLVNGNQKRVHCDLADSSQAAPLDSIDMDVDILEITPLRSGSRNAYGPVLPADFDDFHRLTKLVIKNNGIQSIPTATARQLSQLISLDLTGNGVKNLADLSLTNFRQLSVCDTGGEPDWGSVGGQAVSRPWPVCKISIWRTIKSLPWRRMRCAVRVSCAFWICITMRFSNCPMTLSGVSGGWSGWICGEINWWIFHEVRLWKSWTFVFHTVCPKKHFFLSTEQCKLYILHCHTLHMYSCATSSSRLKLGTPVC